MFLPYKVTVTFLSIVDLLTDTGNSFVSVLVPNQPLWAWMCKGSSLSETLVVIVRAEVI